jgi:hypothetical protein
MNNCQPFKNPKMALHHFQCFINSKTADIHRSPFPNIFLLIYANGSVWTNYRLKLQGPCEMDLTRFPFDNVTCSLTFESFNYNTDEVEMHWSTVGVAKMRDHIELADYLLVDILSDRQTVVGLLCTVFFLT